MDLEELPLQLKNNVELYNLFNHKICKVAVLWIIYDPYKKNIIYYGSSRPRGINYRKASTHAEIIAWNKLKKHSRSNKLEIYIWRWNTSGKYIPKYSCSSCTKYAYKYKFDKRLFTFENGNKISSIIENPPLCLSNTINK